jgi:ubiquinone/menaquinone biosynthesis C-methylase UbiE
VTSTNTSLEPQTQSASICDYEGSDYQKRFWTDADRAYEDAVERVAIRRLLPPKGRRIIEFGAGFGRLGELYTGYDQIVLLDYSRSLLREGMQKWGHDPRFVFVAADLYKLPFASGVFSAATMIRVIHHIADVPAVLSQIRKALAPGSTFVFEFANKRNLKALARHASKRQDWNPNDREPVEFVKLNFDFHPDWMLQKVRHAGFGVEDKLSASYLRAGFLKRALPLKAMVGIDAALQRTAGLGMLSPSVFLKLKSLGSASQHQTALNGDTIFRSPASGMALRREGDFMVCDGDGTRWRVEGNLYDFKEPVGA